MPEPTAAEHQQIIETLRAERDASQAREAALLGDLQQSREYQTATSDVLKIISGSSFDLQPTLQTIIETATRLCRATGGTIWLATPGGWRWGASANPAPGWTEYARGLGTTALPEASKSTLAVAVRERRVVHIEDTEAIPDYPQGARSSRQRTVLTAPMLCDGEVAGVISLHRRHVELFTSSQVDLLATFAAQAAIALENTRLLTDQREALERQTATAEILQTINESPGDPAPVFEVILEKAHNLCNAEQGSLQVYDGETFRAVATRGMPDEFAEYLRQPRLPSPGILGMPIDRTTQVVDLKAERARHPDDELLRSSIENAGVQTHLRVPLLRDGGVVGRIIAARRHVEAFTDRQIALLESFAAQAVIAMDNARLLTEQREALERQTATAAILRVINESPGNLQPVFDTIVEQALRLCAGAYGSLATYRGDETVTHAARGWPEALRNWIAENRNTTISGGPRDRVLTTKHTVHILDLRDEPNYPIDPAMQAAVELAGMGTVVMVPLLSDQEVTGVISVSRTEVRPFTDKEITLLESFAAQAVIAMENARLLTEQREALERQTATAEILATINANAGNVEPVFDIILEKAHRLCNAEQGSLQLFENEIYRAVATRGLSEQWAAILRQGLPPSRLAATMHDRTTHTVDAPALLASNPDDPVLRATVEIGGYRTILRVPLLSNGRVLGRIMAARSKVEPFTDHQIALLESFAGQAVIAMENARLLTEQREALEQQTATAEILATINANPGNLQSVFDIIVEKSLALCGASFGGLLTYDGKRFHRVSIHLGGETALLDILRELHSFEPRPGTTFGRMLESRRPDQIPDLSQTEGFRSGRDRVGIAMVARGLHAQLVVPLLKEGNVVGAISLISPQLGLFPDKQIAVLESFAAQAVIAMENAHLLGELRARTDDLARREEELRVTFENMADGVAMFDASLRLLAWNANFQHLLDLPDDFLAARPTFADYIRALAARGEYGPNPDAEAQIARSLANPERTLSLERTRPNGRILELRRNPIATGGFVIIYADITERKQAEANLRAARDAAEAALADLKRAQDRLVQSEKMASLGQLTAGIAHEIKNPLNFVNNFADLSTELLDELTDAIAANDTGEIADLTATLKSNLQKVVQHGKRADGIVRNMLLHSRESGGERREVDLNLTVEEALNLAYHGARAEKPGFNITLARHYDPAAGTLALYPQEFTRVLINLIGNGFYAATKRKAQAGPGFEPTLTVTTEAHAAETIIRIRDNGTGMPEAVKARIFEPFFTTKPAGEGTGLGLSLSHDIIVKQHGGGIAVDSRENDFTEFTITLPKTGAPA